MRYNLLIITPIVEKLGALMFDKKGTVLPPRKQYKRIHPALTYFSNRKNKRYHVESTEGSICLGANTQDDTVSNNCPDPSPRNDLKQTVHEDITRQPHIPEKRQRKMTKSQQRVLVLPLRNRSSKAPKFEVREDSLLPLEKMAKYECHLILNHCSPAKLTQPARNRYIYIPELDRMSANDRACYEDKLSRAPHRRGTHTYKRGHAISSEIMGPLQIPGMPTAVERYFISFIDMATRYSYVAPIASRAQASTMIQDFLTRIEDATGNAPVGLSATTRESTPPTSSGPC